MSAQDPDVRPDLECALREEIMRKEERIRLLEAQLAQASPTADAILPQTPPSPATRPPIRLPVFDGAPVSVIADRVQALANARNASASAPLTAVTAAPPRFAVTPDDEADGFEPTARLDAGQLRHAHRALPRNAAHRRTSVALLCLGAATLWGGIWQMRLHERHNAVSPAPQSAMDAPVIAEARLPDATPVVLPEAELRTAGSLPTAAVPMEGTERAGENLPRATYTARSIAPPVVLNSPRPASLAAAEAKNGSLSASAQSDARPTSTLKAERKQALPARRQTTLAQTAATQDAAGEQANPNRKTRLLMPPAKRQQTALKVARLTAWVSHPKTLTLREQDIASAHPSPSSEPDAYGIGESGSPASQERGEEQARTVHEPRSASHARAERTSDIETNVDHAMQTLDKMRELLDGMDKGRKIPAHP